jgi:iron complex outermembrane receptor protein
LGVDFFEGTMTNKPLKNFLMLACAPLALAAFNPARAADSAAAARDTVRPGTEIEEIVVTALKRETNLQETPIAISVLGVQGIEDRHVQSLMDLGDGAIAGLRVATFEARQSALTIGIRGIVPLDANQPAREQGVGVYLDGVYLGRQQGLNAALLDIDHIEVLKGPQGTLFGRNTEGGALSIVTKGPTGNFGARVVGGVGNYGQYNGEAHVDFPRLGQFSFKLDGVVQYQRPTTKNPLAGQTGFNFYNRRGGKFATRWEPTDAFTADYTFDAGRDENSPFYSQLLNFNPNNLPVGPATGTLPAGQIRPLPSIVKVEGVNRMDVADIGVPQQPSVDQTLGHALHLNWKATDDLELRSISAYRTVRVSQWDNSGGAHRVPQFIANTAFSRYSLSILKQHQLSQEFQAVGKFTDAFDYVAGLYYFEEKAEEEAATPSSNMWNATGTGYTILDPTLTLPGSRSIDRGSFANAKSYAAFGQGTYTPAFMDHRLHLTAGGRYTHDDKNGTLYKVNNVASNFTFLIDSGHFDPMVTLAFDAAEDVNLYAKYASGYRSGGASSRSLTHRAFGSEIADSYEIGAKTELFNKSLRLNAAAYMMDRTGSQIDFSVVAGVIPGSTRNTVETVNAPGTTKIKGLELEATWRLTPELSLSGSYAYTDTKIPPTLNPFNNVVQPVFIVFTPRNTAGGAIDYTMPMDTFTFKAHLDANYAQSTQTFDQTPVTNDASFIVNGRLAVADIDMGANGAMLTLSLWSRNLLNEAHVYRRDPANRSTIGDYGNFNAPRTFGLEASLKY